MSRVAGCNRLNIAQANCQQSNGQWPDPASKAGAWRGQGLKRDNSRNIKTSVLAKRKESEQCKVFQGFHSSWNEQGPEYSKVFLQVEMNRGPGQNRLNIAQANCHQWHSLKSWNMEGTVFQERKFPKRKNERPGQTVYPTIMWLYTFS